MPAEAGNPFESLTGPIALVCHDAGAANTIISWAQDMRKSAADFRVCMRGPAARLWEQAFPDVPSFAQAQDAMDGAAVLVSGSGWASDLEHLARMQARMDGRFCVAVLDHWVNYAQRFERSGQTVLPDEFWVTDDEALSEAQRCFPELPVRQFSNLYLMAQTRQIKAAGPGDPAEVLYVLEPARSTWGKGVQGEFQALDYFAANIAKTGLPSGVTVRLRPHPSDLPEKYEDWIAKNPQVHCILDETASLAESISRASWVAGCESFALVIALAAGRRVICTLPPWAPACRLPHKGLLHLKNWPEPR